MTPGLNYSVSGSCCAPSRCLQLRSAGRTHCLFVVPAACSQTGHYSPQPSAERVRVGARVCVNVLGGVHRGAGRAPTYRNGKSAAYVTAPSSSSAHLKSRSPPSTYRWGGGGGRLALDLLGANGDGGEGKQLLGGFCWLAEAQGARRCCCTPPTANHILCQH